MLADEEYLTTPTIHPREKSVECFINPTLDRNNRYRISLKSIYYLVVNVCRIVVSKQAEVKNCMDVGSNIVCSSFISPGNEF